MKIKYVHCPILEVGVMSILEVGVMSQVGKKMENHAACKKTCGTKYYFSF